MGFHTGRASMSSASSAFRTGAVDFRTVLRGAPAGTPLVLEVFNGPLLHRHGIDGFAQVLADAARTVLAGAAG